MSMSNDVNAKEEFKLVTYKRKPKKNNVKLINSGLTNLVLSETETETIIRRVEHAKLEVASSDLFGSIKASLREGLETLNNPNIKEVLCLGLGRFTESTISRYQLALLLCLKDTYTIHLNFYDPIFSKSEHTILKKFGCNILTENTEGRYKIKNKETTIFYLPHCPKELTNNLLWSNWGLNLHYCIIISNSFTKIVDNCPKSLSKNNSYEYIHKILPHILELAVINNFKYYEVFNDTAIHIFPWKNLCLVTDDFWQNCCKPTYEKDDSEIITDS